MNSNSRKEKTQTTKTNENKKSIWKTKYFKAILIVFSIIGVLFLCAGGYAYAYKNKIYPGVKIAGISLGGKTINQAQTLLAPKLQDIESQKIVAVVNQSQVETNLPQIGITYSAKDLANQTYLIGHNKNWIQNAKQLYQLNIKKVQPIMNYNFNNDSWNSFIGQLDSKLGQTAEIPHLELQSNAVKIVLGKAGVTILNDKLKNQILTQVKNNNFSKIVVPTETTQITISDSQIKTITSQAENYTQPISLTYNNKTYTATKDIILSWLILNRNNDNTYNLTISDDAINKYLATIAAKTDAKAINKQITPAGQVLSEGTPGLALDKTNALSQIKSAMNGGNHQIALVVNNIDPTVKTIYPEGTPGLFPGKYIEVSLSKQTLYAFDGNTLVNQFLISSGTSAHPTPTGTFAIWAKVASELMQGPDYYLPNVQWVSKFTYDGDAIHGTYWHHNFGHPMSHGCLNATNADAEWIFNWADIGTPVVVHQ